MKLKIGNTHTHAELTANERLWLSEFLSFDDASQSWRGGKHRAPKRESLLTEADLFPSGLASLVAQQARADGLSIEIARVGHGAPCVRDPSADIGWLRDHQRRAVTAVCQRGRGVLELPTGAGKTEIAVALRRVLPCRWLFLVHRDVLREQTVERFNKRAAEHGLSERALLWTTSERDPWRKSNFVVASFQGLASARKHNPTAYHALTGSAQGIIADEAHVLPSDTFYTTALDCTSAYYRVALSATAFERGDRRSVMLIAAIGPSIFKVTPQELIDAGLLTQPRVELHPHIQESHYRKWTNVEREQIVRCASRNDLIAKLARECDKPALVYVKQLEHLGTLRAALTKHGVNALVVSGRESTAQRKAALKLLERGDYDAIVCTVVFQEGVDLPSLASVINASGGKSKIAAIQRAGRALRPAPGKTVATIYDVDDRGVPMLARHTAGRRAAYLKQGYPVTVSPVATRAPKTPAVERE